MTTSRDIPTIPFSFVYGDFVSQVKVIQDQVVNIANILDNRRKNEKRTRYKLKSRSLTFIDPYGNKTVEKSMDHQLIYNAIIKYKKNYIPKYLQRWLKIGTMDKNIISSLNNYELKSTVSQYANGHQFIAYSEVTVWLGNYETLSPRKFVMQVLLMDNMEKIKERLQLTNVELKSCIINQNTKPNKDDWNEGGTLTSEDTIMSCRLYQDNCVIMAKFIKENACDTEFSADFLIFVKTLTGKTVNLSVNSKMDVMTLKELLQKANGVPPDQQRLIFTGKQMEDERTLADYNVANGSTIYMILRLRGGMYHLSSGRQDFDNLAYNSAEAVKNVLSFKPEDLNDVSLSSSTELQNSMLQAQTVLSTLYRSTGQVDTSDNLENLKLTILPTPVDVDEDSSDKKDDEDDVSSKQ